VKARLRAEDGFGLLELLMAMVILNVGILAIVAAFNSGALALKRASASSTASAVADKQMEQFRAVRNCAIFLTVSKSDTANGADSTYTGDSAFSSVDGTTVGTSPNQVTVHPITSATTGLPSPIPANCGGGGYNPSNTAATGADGRTYRVDVYIFPFQPSGGGWTKQVTVVVRDSTNATRTLARMSSTFDPSTAP
jgi:Tfp pilus assembly protein PilV